MRLDSKPTAQLRSGFGVRSRRRPRLHSRRCARITSAIPRAAELRGFRIEGNTTAVAELAGLPEEANAVERVRVIAQVTRSLVGLSGIERVRLRNDGSPWGLSRMSGGIADDAYGYDELLGFSRVCVGKPGTEIAEGDCFSALP